ncbi:MAG: hypothetical protein KBC38_00730 [Candidatus Pacebacteria bacterium]|nr:hypothetical protein [Candidatus Paceibacterota bacterium]MBP9840521.1 hypothetical protein [Candidatus Paceibacterota bacterium]
MLNLAKLDIPRLLRSANHTFDEFTIDSYGETEPNAWMFEINSRRLVDSDGTPISMFCSCSCAPDDTDPSIALVARTEHSFPLSAEPWLISAVARARTRRPVKLNVSKGADALHALALVELGLTHDSLALLQHEHPPVPVCDYFAMACDSAILKLLHACRLAHRMRDAYSRLH